MPAESLAVVGLGYVGLPLAVAFGSKIRTVGFDISRKKVEHYKKGTDPAGEISPEEFEQARHLSFTCEPADLGNVSMIVVAVPTPVNASKLPNLKHVISASKTVGKNLGAGMIVVYESTVYPGVTEEICIPVLEKYSGLKAGRDFKVGYSPERLNPGDREHSLSKIVKVVAAQDPATLETVAKTYELVVAAGVYKAKSIKVAEAAKVIENTQRDLNIALMNELAIIFNRLGIDTQAVLEAANTKWNFLPFTPGLVGGHCIGVDPYYLTYKAQQVGYHPEVILAGRRINDGMGSYVAQRMIKELIYSGIRVAEARIALLGLSFKENCADIRNSRVVDIIRELREYGIEPVVHDPLANPSDAKAAYGIALREDLPRDMDGVIMAVAHDYYSKLGPASIYKILKDGRGVIIDVKGLFEPEDFSEESVRYWRL